MTAFVKEAAVFAGAAGQEAACESFNNLSGPYVSGERYVFAYDMNGTTLALPYQTGLIGKNRMDLTDVNGLSVISAMVDIAKRGGGQMYYVYPNPQNGYLNQLKICRVEPVDSGWFVGSGIYLPWISAELDQDKIQVLIDRVKNGIRHAGNSGKEQAIRDFNDLNQSFADKEEYIFAYGYDGTTLALPHQPEIIGTNRMDFPDIYGTPVTVQEIDAAQRGGGFVYIVYYNPETGINELKLCYVLPAGDDWLVGSGIYTGTDLA
jgi:signal transduction histidine kinase